MKEALLAVAAIATVASARARAGSKAIPRPTTGLQVKGIGIDLTHEGDLRGVVMKDTDLSDAMIARRDMRGAVLDGSVLRGAVLVGSNLLGASLRKADLRGADLTNARLDLADLRGANLSAARIVNSSFRGADLRGADLCAESISESDFYRAMYDDKTRMKSNFSPEDQGMISSVAPIRVTLVSKDKLSRMLRDAMAGNRVNLPILCVREDPFASLTFLDVADEMLELVAQARLGGEPNPVGAVVENVHRRLVDTQKFFDGMRFPIRVWRGLNVKDAWFINMGDPGQSWTTTRAVAEAFATGAHAGAESHGGSPALLAGIVSRPQDVDWLDTLSKFYAYSTRDPADATTKVEHQISSGRVQVASLVLVL